MRSLSKSWPIPSLGSVLGCQLSGLVFDMSHSRSQAYAPNKADEVCSNRLTLFYGV